MVVKTCVDPRLTCWTALSLQSRALWSSYSAEARGLQSIGMLEMESALPVLVKSCVVCHLAYFDAAICCSID